MAKVEPHEFAYAMQLFLAAGRDSDAAALVERRLAAIPAKSVIERGAIVDTAVMLYSGAKPVRLDAADQLLLHRAKTSSDRVSRLKTYSTMLIAANNVADSVHAIRAAKLIMGVADSLTVADRQSDAVRANARWLRRIALHLRRDRGTHRDEDPDGQSSEGHCGVWKSRARELGAGHRRTP